MRFRHFLIFTSFLLWALAQKAMAEWTNIFRAESKTCVAHFENSEFMFAMRMGEAGIDFVLGQPHLRLDFGQQLESGYIEFLEETIVPVQVVTPSRISSDGSEHINMVWMRSLPGDADNLFRGLFKSAEMIVRLPQAEPTTIDLHAADPALREMISCFRENYPGAVELR